MRVVAGGVPAGALIKDPPNRTKRRRKWVFDQRKVRARSSKVGVWRISGIERLD
jgi:hypothetical protein